MPRAEIGAVLPTPLLPMARLGPKLGIDLMVKRDDLTGVGSGGNKIRKLELLLGEAVTKRADVLITTGGAQSNHAQLTASCAARLGMRSIVLLRGDPQQARKGNLLLEDLLGTEVILLESDDYFANIDRYLVEIAEREQNLGAVPYVIPLGGATPLGSLGYVAFCDELAAQAAEQGLSVSNIVAAVGSCGMLAGLLAGTAIFLPGAQVVGVSVAHQRDRVLGTVSTLVPGAWSLLGLDAELASMSDFCCIDDYVGPGYAIATPEGLDAIQLVARTEGIYLDPVYTGKAMAGLVGLARNGQLAGDGVTVFIHSGGFPALFADTGLQELTAR